MAGAATGSLSPAPAHQRPADRLQIGVDVVSAPPTRASVAGHGLIVLSPLAVPSIGNDLDRVGDIGELAPEKVDEVSTLRRDDEKESRWRH